MSAVMNKYKATYQLANGDELSKVKAVIMYHANEWDLNADGMIADLLDDANITAEDVVDFLATLDEQGEGNDEFHAAVRAIQVALRKSRLMTIKTLSEAELNAPEFSGEEDYLYQQMMQPLNIADYLGQH
jgi:hypothetical protein